MQYNSNLNLTTLVYIKDLLQLRKDYIIYFIDENGKGLCKGAIKLIKKSKIKSSSKNKINTLNIQKHRNKIYFGLCINPKESIKLILNNIENVFLQIIQYFNNFYKLT